MLESSDPGCPRTAAATLPRSRSPGLSRSVLGVVETAHQYLCSAHAEVTVQKVLRVMLASECRFRSLLSRASGAQQGLSAPDAGYESDNGTGGGEAGARAGGRPLSGQRERRGASAAGGGRQRKVGPLTAAAATGSLFGSEVALVRTVAMLRNEPCFTRLPAPEKANITQLNSGHRSIRVTRSHLSLRIRSTRLVTLHTH